MSKTKSATRAHPTAAGNLPVARRRRLLGAAAIFFLTYLAYVPALHWSAFIWDDDFYVTHNDAVKSPDGLSDIWSPRAFETVQYYPLVFTSFWLEYRLFGQDEHVFHTVNVLLHCVNALLVWRIARRLGVPAAWFVGAVFAVHPVHVESVAWITERKNVLSGLFFLLALSAYLRFDDLLRAGHFRRAAGRYAAALVLFVAALLSKTVTAMLAPLLPLLLFYKYGAKALRRPTVWALALVLPLLLIGAGFGFYTAYLERAKVGAIGEEFSQSFGQRALIIAPSAYAFYAQKIIWPQPLIFNYARWNVNSPRWTLYLALPVVLAALAIALAGARRFGRGPVTALLFSAITLFPALGFFNVYPHRYSYVADHFQYLGSLGFIALFVGMAIHLTRRVFSERWLAALRSPTAFVVLAVLAALTFRQSRAYENEETLWRDTVAKNPDSWFAMNNLGVYLAQRYQYDEAIRWFQGALEHEIARPEAYQNWGDALFLQDRFAEAATLYEKSLEANPDRPLPALGLGECYMRLGRFDEAGVALERAVGLAAPLDARRWHRLAQVRRRQRRLDDMKQCLERAVELAPDEPTYRAAYGKHLAQRGLFREAAEHLRLALASNPVNPDGWLFLIISLTKTGQYADAWQACEHVLRVGHGTPHQLERTARLLAACPDDSIRDGARAQRLVDRVRQMVPDEKAPPDFLDTYGAVAAENGDFATALAFARRALDLVQRQNVSNLVTEYERRIELYRTARPYRLSSR